MVHRDKFCYFSCRVLFTAFFLKDSSGSVYFATCFHNLCNEGEDRSKLKGEDFVRRLKDCTCHPFHTSDDSLDLDVTLKGVDILGDEPRPQPQMYPVCCRIDCTWYIPINIG